MNGNTKSMNRLFLGMMIWAIGAPYLFLPLLSRMDMAASNVAGEVIFALPVLVFLLVKRTRPQEWIPFRRIGAVNICLSGLIGFLLLPLVTFINAFTMLFSTNYVSETGTEMMENPFLVNLLVVAVIPAVVEELVYRGIFYHGYREKGVWMGALASAVIFGAMHRNMNQFCYAAVLGVAFVLLVEITGSIYSSMAAHFVINGWNVCLLALQKPLQQLTEAVGDTAQAEAELTGEMLVSVMGVFGVIALVSTSLAAGVMVFLTKRCKREPHMRWCFRRHPLPEGEKRHFVTPSFVAAMVITVGYMILLELATLLSAVP